MNLVFPLRTPRVVPWWLPALVLLVGFAAFVALVYAGHDDLGVTVLVVALSAMFGLLIWDVVATRSRSRAIRARLTAADVAARVDLAAVAAALRGGPKSQLAGVRMVQRAFPHLLPADAVEVTRVALPTEVPPRRTPERWSR